MVRIKNNWCGVREMAQWSRALATLSEEPGSILSTQMADHNCMQFLFLGIACSVVVSACHSHAQRENMHTHRIS